MAWDGHAVILRIWSISVPPAENTSMRLLLRRYIHGKFRDGPWKRILVDYAGPFKGEMILVVVDAFFRWFEVAIVTQTTSTTTIGKLREIFAQHGLPDMLLCDNGTNFISEEFAQFLRSKGIIHVKTAPDRPSNNGLAKRAVQTSKRWRSCYDN